MTDLDGMSVAHEYSLDSLSKTIAYNETAYADLCNNNRKWRCIYNSSMIHGYVWNSVMISVLIVI